MGWKRRGRGRYYYRNRRVAGRVVSMYLGTSDDDLPREAALEVRRDARRRARGRERARREEEGRREGLARLRAVLGLGALVERALLERMGFHRHARGTWRKRRMKTPTTTEAAPPAPTEAAPPAPREELVARAGAAWNEVSGRARAGDASCLPELREMLGVLGDKTIDQLGDTTIDQLGNTARHAEEALLRSAYGTDLLAVEAVRMKLARVKAELAGPAPTASERLLAERAAFAWMAVNVYETLHAQVEGQSVKQASFQQQRIDLAHRRFLQALKALAVIRRLALPALMQQINIGHQQAIMNGGPPPASPPAPAPPGQALPCPARPGPDPPLIR